MIGSESKVHCGSAIQFVPGVSRPPYYRAPFGARGKRMGFSSFSGRVHTDECRGGGLNTQNTFFTFLTTKFGLSLEIWAFIRILGVSQAIFFFVSGSLQSSRLRVF